MSKLNFNGDICRSCSSVACLENCQYIDIDKDKAKEEIIKIIEGEDSFVLDDCATCYACEEYCPHGNHPFYLISERREEKDILTAPRPIVKQWINMVEPRGKFFVGDIEDRALSYCYTEIGDYVDGKIFEGLESSIFMGAEFFCQVVYLHFAKPSVIKERLPKVVERIGETGVKELICLHDECYGGFTSLADAYNIEVPFEPIHYFEFLYEKLKDFEDEIEPLDLKVAYQRPCSSRLAPDTHQYVEKIFDIIGVEQVDREYRDENALCCGAILKLIDRPRLSKSIQKRNIDDMADSGADYCVFNCPYCEMALSEKVSQRGITPIHMIELCRASLGELEDF